MRLIKSIVASVTFAAIALSGSLTLKSDVPGEFLSVHLVEKNYVPIVGGTVLEADDFTIPPNIPDVDDGYHRINIGFPFEYNGDVFTELWICVNGFITFDRPLFTIQPNPNGLFRDLPSTYQQNVVAPFWGDHIFRTPQEELAGYTPTRIIYKRENGKLTIEWRDLNILDKSLTSSIADFQVILYESDDPLTPQGDIEFAYGLVGGNTNPLNTETEVITKGASVGIKGEFNDFLNGLYPCTDDPADMTECVLPATSDSTTLTNEWQPSGATNYRIKFTAKKTLNVEEFWGDGDVDFSKTPGERHFNRPQNRYVTFNDVRLILRSMATQVPLDSIRRRAAYHGDVNHNGRYYYREDLNGNPIEKVEITRKDENYFDNLPSEITSIKKVFYQVNEHDAAVIMAYLGGKNAELPWLVDSTVFIGKQNEVVTNNSIRLGDKITANGVTEIPVYLNYAQMGPLSVSFDVNATIKTVRTASQDEMKEATTFGTNNVFFASAGEYNTNDPIFYVEVTDLTEGLNLNNIRVNDINVGSITEETNVEATTVQVSPNPVVNGTTNYTITIENDGNYNLSVFDAVGNKVAELYNGNLKKGELTQRWDAVDSFGGKLNSGVYFLKLEGNGVNSVQKVVISR